MLKNEKLVKTLLTERLVVSPKSFFSANFWPKFFTYTISTLAVITITLGWLNKESVALAHINPFATPEAKAKNFLQTAVKSSKQSPEPMLDNFEKEIESALKAQDATLVKNSEDHESEKGENEKFLVNGELVDSLGEVFQIKPKEVKRQIKFTQEDGSTVVLGFNKQGQAIFKATGIARNEHKSENEDEQERDEKPEKEKVEGASTEVESGLSKQETTEKTREDYRSNTRRLETQDQDEEDVARKSD